MKVLTIDWRHYEKGGETCDRCAATGKTVQEVVADLTQQLADKGVKVEFTETVLPEELMTQSNLILFNGSPLEDLLRGASSFENACPSCSCLTGKDTVCRTVEHDGVIHEDTPAELIRRAALQAIDLITD